jgi:hypothetical protein
MGVDLRIGGDRAFYVPPPLDYVQVPPPQAYFHPLDWHRRALHEMVPRQLSCLVGSFSECPRRVRSTFNTGKIAALQRTDVEGQELPLKLRRHHVRCTPESCRLAATPKSAALGRQRTIPGLPRGSPRAWLIAPARGAGSLE